MQHKFLALTLLVLAPVLSLGGCASRAQEGALIGSAVGAGAGYIIGNEMDKDDGYYRDHHHHHYRYR